MCDDDKVKIYFWPNGEKKEKIFFFDVPKNIPNLLRLKEIITYKDNSAKVDQLRLFKSDGIEMDDSDTDTLFNNQIIFYSRNGESFSSSNQYSIYEFIKWIKSGGFGEVYLAKNCITKQLYAIKRVSLARFTTEDLYNISREKVYMENFRNKYIVQFHGSFSYNDAYYIIMDYAKGGELGKYVVANGPLKENEAKRIFLQIHEGVSYMHSQNTIHRDLKPNNILFLDEEHKNIVIIDFGICGFSNGNDKEIIKAGTTDYLPPEIASGKQFQSSPKVDVWALGVILYYMLFKELPFKGKGDKEIISNILNNNPDLNLNGIGEKLTGRCLTCLKKMLDKNPSKRCSMDDQCFLDWFNGDETSDEQDKEVRDDILHPKDIFRTYTTSPLKSSGKKKRMHKSEWSSKNIVPGHNYEASPFDFAKGLRGGGGSPNSSRKRTNMDNSISSSHKHYAMSPKNHHSSNYKEEFSLNLVPTSSPKKNNINKAKTIKSARNSSIVKKK